MRAALPPAVHQPRRPPADYNLLRLLREDLPEEDFPEWLCGLCRRGVAVCHWDPETESFAQYFACERGAAGRGTAVEETEGEKEREEGEEGGAEGAGGAETLQLWKMGDDELTPYKKLLVRLEAEKEINMGYPSELDVATRDGRELESSLFFDDITETWRPLSHVAARVREERMKRVLENAWDGTESSKRRLVGPGPGDENLFSFEEGDGDGGGEGNDREDGVDGGGSVGGGGGGDEGDEGGNGMSGDC